MDKKNKLKSIIENDHKAKLDHRQRTNELSKSNDFQDNSVLAYLYKNKEHRAFALGAKKDHIIGIM